MVVFGITATGGYYHMLPLKFQRGLLLVPVMNFRESADSLPITVSSAKAHVGTVTSTHRRSEGGWNGNFVCKQKQKKCYSFPL